MNRWPQWAAGMNSRPPKSFLISKPFKLICFRVGRSPLLSFSISQSINCSLERLKESWKMRRLEISWILEMKELPMEQQITTLQGPWMWKIQGTKSVPHFPSWYPRLPYNEAMCPFFKPVFGLTWPKPMSCWFESQLSTWYEFYFTRNYLPERMSQIFSFYSWTCTFFPFVPIHEQLVAVSHLEDSFANVQVI